jgi:hypothetical protein
LATVKGIKSEFFDFTQPLPRIPDLSGRTPTIPPRVDDMIGKQFQLDGYAWHGLDDRFAETFASRHSGILRIPKAGSYTFFLKSDDGSKLWIDGNLVIDNDGLQSLQEMNPLPSEFKPNDGHYVLKEKASSKLNLPAGDHAIRVEFFKSDNADRLLAETETWYFDYGADQIYMATEPTGGKLEVSAIVYAFSGPANGRPVARRTPPRQTGARLKRTKPTNQIPDQDQYKLTRPKQRRNQAPWSVE